MAKKKLTCFVTVLHTMQKIAGESTYGWLLNFILYSLFWTRLYDAFFFIRCRKKRKNSTILIHRFYWRIKLPFLTSRSLFLGWRILSCASFPLRLSYVEKVFWGRLGMFWKMVRPLILFLSIWGFSQAQTLDMHEQQQNESIIFLFY